jgi:hypothetical protein
VLVAGGGKPQCENRQAGHMHTSDTSHPIDELSELVPLVVALSLTSRRPISRHADRIPQSYVSGSIISSLRMQSKSMNSLLLLNTCVIYTCAWPRAERQTPHMTRCSTPVDSWPRYRCRVVEGDARASSQSAWIPPKPDVIPPNPLPPALRLPQSSSFPTALHHATAISAFNQPHHGGHPLPGLVPTAHS